MKWLIALALLWPSFALAQAGGGPGTVPSGMGRPHACGSQWYPPSAVANNEQGTVGLDMRIDTSGNTKDITVSATSGFPDLDQAAVACAQTWKYKPAAQDGVPVEVSWKANVKWAINRDAVIAPTASSGIPHACQTSDFPHEVVRSGIGGIVGVSFRISVAGVVVNPNITQSSGDPKLDEATLECVSRWVYKPVILDGQPVEVPWAANVRWNVENDTTDTIAPVPTGPAHACPQPPDSRLTPTATLISFSVATDGRVLNPKIAKSSGDDGVDKYAVTCVSGWKYQPGKRGSVPAQTELIARLVWTQAQGASSPKILPPTPNDSKPVDCSQSLSGRKLPDNLGPTELSFTVKEDGSVQDVNVTKSSGDPDVDLAAGLCAYKWHYNPATQNGTPVEVSWHETMTWKAK